jgi:hypothetical protein
MKRQKKVSYRKINEKGQPVIVAYNYEKTINYYCPITCKNLSKPYVRAQLALGTIVLASELDIVKVRCGANRWSRAGKTPAVVGAATKVVPKVVDIPLRITTCSVCGIQTGFNMDTCKPCKETYDKPLYAPKLRPCRDCGAMNINYFRCLDCVTALELASGDTYGSYDSHPTLQRIQSKKNRAEANKTQT